MCFWLGRALKKNIDNCSIPAQMESTYGEDKSRSDFSFSSFLLGSFGNDDGDGNENVKKAIGLLRKQLCTYITLFCTFLCRHCTTTT